MVKHLSFYKGCYYFNNTCGEEACIKKSRESTCMEKYGSKVATQSDVVKDKIKNTNIERYGSAGPMGNEKVKELSRKNLMDKYGVSNVSQLQAVKDKKEKTFIEHYGYPHSFQAPEIKERIKNTNLEKYGYENSFSSPEIIKKSKRKYRYKNIGFDSSWELVFYIYCEDHNIDIERNPDPIPYYVNNVKHLYYPDFKIKNNYIEIKGDHMMDPEGNISFHPSFANFLKDANEETIRKYEEILKEKNNLIKKLKVKILKEENLKNCLSYIISRYGKSYIQSFRT